MTTTQPLTLSNPRRLAVFHDWPAGPRRTTREFAVQTDDGGRERCLTWTTGRPKTSAWFNHCRIVDGDDGRTYVVGFRPQYAVLMAGNLEELDKAYQTDELYHVVTNLINSNP